MSLAIDASLHEHIIQAGGVTGLLNVLQNGSELAQTNAAGAFLNLSENPASRPSVAVAVSCLRQISRESKNKKLQLWASSAVSHLGGSNIRDMAAEQETGNLTA